MIRARIASLALRAYPRNTRLARGPEMLSTLLDVSEGSTLAFARECAGLVVGGVRDRMASTSVRVHRRRALAAVAVTTIVAVGAILTRDELSRSPGGRTNIRALAAAVVPHMRRGDVVLVAEPGQTSVAARDLPVGLLYFVPPGPTRVGELPSLDRQADSGLAVSDPRAALSRLLNTLSPGQHVLFIRPLTEGNLDWSSRSVRTVRRRAAQWGALLAQDPELRVVVTSAPHGVKRSCCVQGSCCALDSAVVYVKRDRRD